MNGLPLFSLFAFVVMIVLVPILFGERMAASLGKLHLSPEVALLLVVAIIMHAEEIADPYLDAYCRIGDAALEKILDWLPYLAAVRLAEDQLDRLRAIAHL
jgi:hypothetical protein